MDEFLGTVKIFGFNFAPRGWMTCQGQILSIATNTALFSLLGTTYGGNGQTTFGLPDLRGRTAIGQGQGSGLQPYSLGQMAGTENVTLTTTQLPPHTHANTIAVTAIMTAEAKQGDAQNPNGKCLATATAPIYTAPDPAANRNMDPTCIVVTANITNAVTGSGAPTPILQPYLCVNYSICTEGLFPSRN